MSIIPITVGRVLHFYREGYSSGEQPWVALVAYVHSDRCINIALFNENGRPHTQPPTSVRLVQPGDPTPSDGPYCKWPSGAVTVNNAVTETLGNPGPNDPPAGVSTTSLTPGAPVTLPTPIPEPLGIQPEG